MATLRPGLDFLPTCQARWVGGAEVDVTLSYLGDFLSFFPQLEQLQQQAKGSSFPCLHIQYNGDNRMQAEEAHGSPA